MRALAAMRAGSTTPSRPRHHCTFQLSRRMIAPRSLNEILLLSGPAAWRGCRTPNSPPDSRAARKLDHLINDGPAARAARHVSQRYRSTVGTSRDRRRAGALAAELSRGDAQGAQMKAIAATSHHASTACALYAVGASHSRVASATRSRARRAVVPDASRCCLSTISRSMRRLITTLVLALVAACDGSRRRTRRKTRSPP